MNTRSNKVRFKAGVACLDLCATTSPLGQLAVCPQSVSLLQSGEQDALYRRLDEVNLEEQKYFNAFAANSPNALLSDPDVQAEYQQRLSESLLEREQLQEYLDDIFNQRSSTAPDAI